MAIQKYNIILLFVLIFFSTLFSEIKPWNNIWFNNKKENTILNKPPKKYLKPYYIDPLRIIFYSTVKIYQKYYNNKYQHCPSYPVCSRFSLISIYDYGFFFGTLMTIDRIFYRENEDEHKFYPEIEIDNMIKLKDLPRNNFIFNKIKW